MAIIELNKAVTTRFPIQEYVKIQKEAEKRGTTIADVIRSSWYEQQQDNKFIQQLLRLEQRQRRTTFEMLCAAIGLKDHERNQALQELENNGVKW